ncbi:MAG: hypothetical protein B6D38_07715 [Anaerolineae bacterium UTCFX1]|jgi:hypothetical protein|nr:MAG: hypothetical protein B6D38_07715 [Anaerolineae bacterium UTCFX1]
MVKQNDKPDGGNHFWAGYGWQVLVVVPLLAAILLSLFFLFFGCDETLLQTNILVVAAWLLLVLFAFWRRPHGEFWRAYRWIIAPAVLILLFLIDTSWAQSALSTSSVIKSEIKATSPDIFQIHAEYPRQIPFDGAELSEIRLWVTGIVNCVDLEVSADGLLFAIKPSSDESLAWSDKLTLKFDQATTAKALLVQSSKSLETDSQSVQLNLAYSGKQLETKGWKIFMESKRDSQIRSWKTNFLNTGGTLVSLITAIFVGIKQLEEEKKRQRAEQVKQAIATFDADARSDFAKMVEEHLNLTADRDEWDKALQDQFRNKYSSLLKNDLWFVIAGETLDEIRNCVDHCSQVCMRIFDGGKGNLILPLEQLQSALQTDENAPRALLIMLKEYPVSIEIAKQIVSAFSPDLKRKIVSENANEFPDQIRILRLELDFPDLDSFPLQRQFPFYAKPHTSEESLTAWLRARELDYSPFADADSPFDSVSNKLLLIDSVAPGFTLQLSNLQNTTFEFAISWDAGAALFEYCKSFQSAVKIKEETFFIAIAPSLIEDHGMDQPRKLYLHALAEQWIWSLAETPALLYSLKDEHRDLAGRLLRWHDLSPSITANKIEGRAKHFKAEIKNQTAFLLRIKEWLAMVGSDDLRMEETNALIGLRPLPKQNTLFLISTIDLNPHVDSQISTSLHEKLGEESDWLSVHDSQQTHFQIGNKSPLLVPQNSLVTQCNNRIRICSQNKVDAFNFLFAPHNEEEPAENILARKAAGSPGRMVRLGQKLLLQHMEKYSPHEDLHIEDLEALQA